ncbi:MAG: PEP-CTERM sorting domain-containing protein [Sedimentisphaerales bacterium]|nr:PEP-CTERM sorting domain-containing protein [Sedimentisphaerales bacterium]
MRSETYLKLISFRAGLCIKFAFIAILCAGGAVLADWDVGNPALYYQLPDESDGWSVYSEWGTGPAGVADNWTAAVTASITEIHFWGGWKDDHVGQIGNILIQIFENGSAGLPGECAWEQVFSTGEYTSKTYSTGFQGWYYPGPDGTWSARNHDDLYQYSIPISTDPFIQQAGQTYWIMTAMDVQGGTWGWNTAESVSGGPAVFWNGAWEQLLTPAGYEDPQTPLDMSFVIVPEPATLILLGLGAAIAGKRKD